MAECSQKFYAAGSVKACFGHTEGAAGIHGALLAIMAVQNSAAPPIMHSRSLNTYVQNAIADWKASCNLTAVVPKVLSPAGTTLVPQAIHMAS